MSTMRWKDYVLAYGTDIPALWDASGAVDRPTLFVLGAGFDPRALVGLRAFSNARPNGQITVAIVDLPPGRSDERTSTLAEQNAASLVDLLAATGYHSERVAYPKTADRRAAGQAISRSLQGGKLIDPEGLVVIDVSALPATLTFPIIGGVLAASDRRTFRGDLQVLICENPSIDRAIVEEGASNPGPVAGFNHGLTESGRDTIRIWAPVLGERQGEQLEALYAYLEPNEITPVLPFPAANPRRPDELVVELRELLFDRMAVEPGNFIYAHETNPFDLYRALWRLSDRFQRALEPLGTATVITSVHGSKMLSMGVLLAAWECKLPVVAAAPTDYLIAEGADLMGLVGESRLACLWLVGEPYV